MHNDPVKQFCYHKHAVKNVDTIRSSVGCCNNAIIVLLAILIYIYIYTLYIYICLGVQLSEWALNNDYIL